MKISFSEAKLILRQKGSPISLPTDTVYGLSVCKDDEEGVKKIFTLKGRDVVNPLCILISNASELRHYVSFIPEKCLHLTNVFWPGPLTLVLPAKEEKISPLIRAGLPTIGVRVPDDPLLISLIKEIGPIVSTSANISGSSPATSAEEVEKIFGLQFPVVDGGTSKIGVASTVLAFEEAKWRFIRKGPLFEKISCLI
jgi:L-threonylcarbamoyladenylate synthase